MHPVVLSAWANSVQNENPEHCVYILRAKQIRFIITFACMIRCFSYVWLCMTPWTAACQAPLSMGFSRQVYWSGLLCPPLGDLPDSGIEPMSLMSPEMAGGILSLVSPGKPPNMYISTRISKNSFQKGTTVKWVYWFNKGESCPTA